MQGRPGSLAGAPTIAEQASTGSVENRPLLLTRDFGLVWSGQLISQIGDGVSKLALLWFVYAVTGSPLKTSVIGLLQTIPPIVLGPLIGVYVDRLPKKVLLITSDVLRALLIGLIPCLIPVESFTVSVLYVLVFLHAIATAVFGPALTAAIPAFVPKRQFTAANALLQGTTSLGIIFGPALSGLGIAAYGSQEVLCLNAATYMVSAAFLLLVRFRNPVTPVSSPAARSDHVARSDRRISLQRRNSTKIVALDEHRCSLYVRHQCAECAFPSIRSEDAWAGTRRGRLSLVGARRRIVGHFDRTPVGDGLASQGSNASDHGHQCIERCSALCVDRDT